MKILIKNYLWIIFPILMFAACEGGTDLQKTFVNNTDSDIEVIAVNNFLSSSDTIHIQANSQKKYFSGGGDRQFFDYQDCLTEIDTFYVNVLDGKSLKKDLMNPDNWSMTTTGKRNIFHSCSIEISPEDLE